MSLIRAVPKKFAENLRGLPDQWETPRGVGEGARRPRGVLLDGVRDRLQ